jgi:RHS repeat-associated protein
MQRYYAHTDLLGSVERLSNSSKTAVQSLSFDEYGDPRLNNWSDGTPTLSHSRAGYTGHEMDVEYGFINMNARLYDPLLGRFISADPIIPSLYNPQSLNRYSYVLNNPFIYADPSGHYPVPVEGGVIEDQWGLYIPANGGPVWDVLTGVSYGSVYDALNILYPGYIQTASGCVGPECSFDNVISMYNSSAISQGNRSISEQSLFLNRISLPFDPSYGVPVTGLETYFHENFMPQAFYISRGMRGDGYGYTGYEVAGNTGLIGISGMQNLYNMARHSGIELNDHIISNIRIDLMNSHFNFVQTDMAGVHGVLSYDEITKYHHAVFSDYGLPSRTFGGTSNTGLVSEAWFTDRLGKISEQYFRLFIREAWTDWCRECDSASRFR